VTVNEIYQTIANEKPSVIYLSGKTSTGKSTFARKLRDSLGYRVIELEAVLLQIVTEKGFDEQSTFRKVLNDPGDLEEKALFFEETDRAISAAISKDRPVVIEGSVANVDTLQRILRPAEGAFFVYFHPNDINAYLRNLTSRFLQSNEDSYAGLPLTFWQLIDRKEFKAFCETGELTEGLSGSIREFAEASRTDSLARLTNFRQKFKDIIEIEIQ
jgi:adenylate kinase family enzyme